MAALAAVEVARLGQPQLAVLVTLQARLRLKEIMAVLVLLMALQAAVAEQALSVEMAQRLRLHLEMAATELHQPFLDRLLLTLVAAVVAETAALVVLLALAALAAVERAALVLRSTEHLELLTPEAVAEQQAEHSQTTQLPVPAAPASSSSNTLSPSNLS